MSDQLILESVKTESCYSHVDSLQVSFRGELSLYLL